MHAVSPLRTPSEAALDAEALRGYEAAQLFLARSADALDGDRLEDTEASVVGRIVARLDGLPLAIELAAGRLRSLPLTELDRVLERRLEVLGGGERTAPPRHRTLGTAIDWSYALLSPEEQRVLVRLAVFPGSFDAIAASAVAADDPADTDAVPLLLSQLVDRSLLTLEAGEPRYRLLQTVRAFLRTRAGASTAYARAAERPTTTTPHWRNSSSGACSSRGWRSGSIAPTASRTTFGRRCCGRLTARTARPRSGWPPRSACIGIGPASSAKRSSSCSAPWTSPPRIVRGGRGA